MTTLTNWGFQGFSQPVKDITVVEGEDLQAAADEIMAAGGGTIHLTSGVHYVDDLRVPSNFVMKGSPDGGTMLKAVEGAYSVLRPHDNVNDMIFKDIIFDASDGRGNGLDLNRNHSNVFIQDCTAFGATKTNVIVYNRDGGEEESRNITVDNVSCFGAKSYHGIAFRIVKGGVISNCKAGLCGFERSGYGIDVSNSDYIEVADCVSSHNNYGMKAPNTTHLFMHDTDIIGNRDTSLKLQRYGDAPGMHVDMRDNVFVMQDGAKTLHVYDGSSNSKPDVSFDELVLKGNTYEAGIHNYMRVKTGEVWGFGEAVGPYDNEIEFNYNRRRADEDPKNFNVGWERWVGP